MMKRIFALLLCLATVLSALAGCSGKVDEDYKGQAITAYLTTNLYDLDPAHAYYNESSADIVGLMFDTLFTLTEDKKVKNSLVKSYEINEDPINNEYEMSLRLKETKWSDGMYVSADDVVFAWKRLLEVEASYEAASLLFDIKNARAAKEGEKDGEPCTVDDVGIYAEEERLVTIQFEGPIDYDQFILNLTSVALAPLREDIVSKSEDWAKKPATMVCSGPFRLARVNLKSDPQVKYFDPNAVQTDIDGALVMGAEVTSQVITDFILERNSYYYRNPTEDSLFKSVLPYRLCVDCSLTAEQVKGMYEAGALLYVGDIPLDLRSDEAIAKLADVSDKSMSTNSIYLNQNKIFDNGTEVGYALFENEAVRQAVSLVIDREAIVEKLVYAEVATGFVPTGVFASGSSKKTFREGTDKSYEYLAFNEEKAASLIDGAKSEIGNPASYTIELVYPIYDEVYKYVAETVVEAWQSLGFTGAVAKGVGTIQNNDYYKFTDSVPVDICDDLYAEMLRAGSFDAIVLDYCAMSVDPYALLAPFAKKFSGQGMDMSDPDNYVLPTHITGYDSEDFNEKMEEVFAEKDIAKRADALYAAEEILMTELPVIPIVFNKRATIMSGDLKKTDSTYYVTTTFTKADVKSYDDYLAAGEAYITDNYDDLAFKASNGNDEMLDPEIGFEVFKSANTIYAQFFVVEEEEAAE